MELFLFKVKHQPEHIFFVSVIKWCSRKVYKQVHVVLLDRLAFGFVITLVSGQIPTHLIILRLSCTPLQVQFEYGIPNILSLIVVWNCFCSQEQNSTWGAECLLCCFNWWSFQGVLLELTYISTSSYWF